MEQMFTSYILKIDRSLDGYRHFFQVSILKIDRSLDRYIYTSSRCLFSRQIDLQTDIDTSSRCLSQDIQISRQIYKSTSYVVSGTQGIDGQIDRQIGVKNRDIFWSVIFTKICNIFHFVYYFLKIFSFFMKFKERIYIVMGRAYYSIYMFLLCFLHLSIYLSICLSLQKSPQISDK